MRQFHITAIILSSVFLIAACSSPIKKDDAAPVANRSGANALDSGSINGMDAGTSDPLNDPQNVLAKRSIYFDLDGYTIKDEFQSVVENHARYLVAHKDRKVVIQGNTDERGGSEYNLALGQKRAEALRRALVLLGVSDNQVEAVSFGKEKPKALGSDEAAYAENRRADIAY